MPEFSEVELGAMAMLLAGSTEGLKELRAQFQSATCKARSFTGSGFFTSFELARSAPRSPIRRSPVGDVYGELNGLKHGAGFLLFLTDGFIDYLECFSFEDWPEVVSLRCLYYVKDIGNGSLVETDVRDM